MEREGEREERRKVRREGERGGDRMVAFYCQFRFSGQDVQIIK